MSKLSYMVRGDWGGASLVANSSTIREWLGGLPVFAVPDVRKAVTDRSVDLETATFITPAQSDRLIVSIGDFARVADGDKVLTRPLAVLHPRAGKDLEVLRNLVGSVQAARVFVMVWHASDPVRQWLDGLGAVDLATGVPSPAVDRMLVEAASMMVDEEYNGLSSGRGKNSVIQLLRTFSAAGYPLETSTWLPAFFAAGGSFDHAQEVAKLVSEMKAGTKHRVELAYRADILDIIRDRVGSGRA